MTKKNSKEKRRNGLFGLQSQSIMRGNQDRNLEAGTERRICGGVLLTALLPMTAVLPFLYSFGMSRGDTPHIKWALPHE